MKKRILLYPLLYFVIPSAFVPKASSISFSTQCWEKLNTKQNMFDDGSCLYINSFDGNTSSSGNNQTGNGWHTFGSNDWVYYPQQYVNISLTQAMASVALVGGCCAPNRYKTTGFIYQDDGKSYPQTGNKIVAISDRPMFQNISVTGWYMKKFVDDGAMNLTIIPSIHHPDKDSILFEIAAFDRAMIVNYEFFDYQDRVIGSKSSGLLRNVITIPDITLPKYTRRILVQFYGSRADPMCFSYIYSGLYVYSPFSTLATICTKVANLLQYASLINFVVTPVVFGIMTLVSDFTFPPPIRFLCRTKSPTVLMCIVIMLGSFILNQAWNLINSQSTIFHAWLPRAARIIELFLSFFLYAVYFYPIFLCYHASYRSRVANLLGAFATCTLFGLRLSLDLPNYAITYARNLPFLIINLLAAVPTFVAYLTVLVYFVTRYLIFEPCTMCSIEALEVEDIEERYVKNMIKSKKHEFLKGNVNRTLFGTIWDWANVKIWNIKYVSVKRALKHPRKLFKTGVRKIFGMNENVRIPFAIKTSLTLLIYCLGQLIPLLLTELIGVGGVVPVHICNWSPYLAQLQYHPDPMYFAIKTFMLMQIAVYIATLGAGGICMIYSLGILRRFTKDILRLRKGDYFLFKGKKNNGIDLDDSIRFFGVFLGFGITGTLYFMVEIALIGTFITMIIQLDRFRDLFFQRVGYSVFFISFFVAFVVQLIQKRITNLVFIENKTRFCIQNRAPFLHYWYFMMLTSMTRALTSYIIRTLKLILRYPLVSVRVDRNAETWSVRRGDGGFTAYCGMILAEHEYNNPIVLVFIECVFDSMQRNAVSSNFFLDMNAGHEKKNRLCKSHLRKVRKQSKNDIEKNEERKIEDIVQGEEMLKEESSTITRITEEKALEVADILYDVNASRKARIRWFLAYTLIQNPGLRQYRVKVDREKKSFSKAE